MEDPEGSPSILSLHMSFASIASANFTEVVFELLIFKKNQKRIKKYTAMASLEQISRLPVSISVPLKWPVMFAFALQLLPIPSLVVA